MSFITTINNIITIINDFIWTYALIWILIGVAIYFTIQTKFVQFRYMRLMVKLLSQSDSQRDKDGNKRNKNGVSSYEAFAISIASRVGTGNIAGVATAIALGGPGAIFWMWVITLLGMSSAFVESTLAQIYKVKHNEGFIGGPAYYIEKALNQRRLGIFFAILLSLTYGFVFNMVQSNTIAMSLKAFNISSMTTGIYIAIAVAVIIFGGVKSIAKISKLFVPTMAVCYVGLTVVVLLLNAKQIPIVFELIFSNAFKGQAALGGSIGVVIMQGIKRGLFSNEAGMGSAPNAAAAADTSHPVKQGLIQSLSVFTDTMIAATCTAFIIIAAGLYTGTLRGVELTQASLSVEIGAIGTFFLVIAIFVFAFSTIIGNYYYAESNIRFMYKGEKIIWFFRCLVVLVVLLGALAEFGIIWNLADLFMATMVCVNLYAIVRLFPKAKEALVDFDKQKKAGKDPVFLKSAVQGLETDSWD